MAFKVTQKANYTTPFTVGTTETLSPASYSTGESLVIWKWNNTDTSQFQTTVYKTTTASSFASSGSSVVVDTTSDIGNQLEFNLDGISTAGVNQFGALFDITDTDLVLPARYVVKVRFTYGLASDASELRVGLMVHNRNASEFWGYGFEIGNASNVWTGARAEGTSASGAAAPFEVGSGVTFPGYQSITAPSTGGNYEFTWLVAPADASNPPYIGVFGIGASNAGVQPAFRLDNTNILSATPDAGWTNRTDTQYMGVYMRGTAPASPATMDATIRIADFVILKHPADWP
jgi:hypothetical protein